MHFIVYVCLYVCMNVVFVYLLIDNINNITILLHEHYYTITITTSTTYIGYKKTR